MTRVLRSTIVGAGIGAGLMFVLDPARGRGRRALMRDKLGRAVRKARDGYAVTRRDARNRLHGLAASIRRPRAGADGEDRTVEARVRAELGRVCSHPRAVRATANSGRITLSGDILASEARAVEAAIRGVEGVTGVDSRLTEHASAGQTPALQGSSERPGTWTAWLKSSWSPTAKLAAGIGVASIAAAALRRP